MSVVEALPLRTSDLQADHGTGARSCPIVSLTLRRDVAEISVHQVDSQVEDIAVRVGTCAADITVQVGTQYLKGVREFVTLPLFLLLG